MDFSETILVYDIKVDRCSQLNEYVNLYEYQRSRSFTDLGPNLSDSVFLNVFSSITTRPIEAKFHVGSKKISNAQQLIQSDPTSCPQNQKGNN